MRRIKQSLRPSGSGVLRLLPSTTFLSVLNAESYGGAEGDRTPGLSIANAALSQLSYGPEEFAMIPHEGDVGRRNLPPRVFTA